MHDKHEQDTKDLEEAIEAASTWGMIRATEVEHEGNFTLTETGTIPSESSSILTRG